MGLIDPWAGTGWMCHREGSHQERKMMSERTVVDGSGMRWSVNTTLLGFASRGTPAVPPSRAPLLRFTSEDGGTATISSAKPQAALCERELLALLKEALRKGHRGLANASG